jgi:hypothetical protein
MPKIGKDPETPMTSIAQERRDRKASGQEHILCPAPESTWNRIASGDVGDKDASNGTILGVETSPVQGRHRQLEVVVGAKATAALTMDRGLFVLVSLSVGKTMRLLAVSNVALSPVFSWSDGVFPATHS